MDKNATRILIVDDEPTMLKALTHRLTRAGYDVVTALDGQEAWTRALKDTPDLVLTDYHMPVMDGLELCDRLARHPATRSIPVIVFSSRWHGVEEQFQALDNVVEFVRKPFSLRGLTDRIGQVLPHHRPAAKKLRTAFSLLELVIVVVIMAIIAAIAIPRMSRGSAGATDSAVAGNLAVLRNAIDLYATEHGGTYPTVANIVNQLRQYTDDAGDAQAVKDATHIYGPYIRTIPPLPVGAKKGETGIAAADGAGVGWIYTVAAGIGSIKTNTTTEADASGKLYSDY